MEVPKVRLYVKSIEKDVGTENIFIDKPTALIINIASGTTIQTYPSREVRTVKKHEYVLPEQQKRVVEIVKEVVSKFGFQLEITDVGQMDLFDKPLPKEVRELKDFPVLATESKTQLATGYTREDVERFLSTK